MTTPRSSADYYRRQQTLLATLLLALRRVWQRMDPAGRWDEQYVDAGIGQQLALLTAAAQTAAARDADAYIAAVLVELGLDPDATPGVVAPAAFAGVAGDGRPVSTLLSLAVPRAGQDYTQRLQVSPAADELERPEWMAEATWEAVERERREALEADIARNRETAANDALALAGRWIETAAATAVIDAARAAESAATTAHRRVTGYVRMLNPPSCSRCAVLAGRFYRWNTGFERHPLCDCRHIPANESIAGDLTVNPHRYFDSLPTADQDRLFTKAGAQAIRDGADINQVVNARRGMQTAQVHGRELVITSEGTTRHGVAYDRGRAVRLMPESIYVIAGDDRDEAIRLLRLNRFIT